ncbi:MAG: hypothetical protein H0U87_01860 [Acidobacteria bacterium]|jgi:hypothetical protein|nr:hypothetical protein [Acidobacteriota bacterium]
MQDDSWLYNPNLYGPGCSLQADGVGFEPKVFLQQTTFDSNLILFQGELGFPEEFKNKVAKVEPVDSQLFETTFLLLRVSISKSHAIQLKEAGLFFEQYRDEILRLSKFPQVENVVLRFMSEEGESFENPSEEFMDLAFSVGVTVIM